jgi:hypothetical protein
VLGRVISRFISQIAPLGAGNAIYLMRLNMWTT